MTVPTETQNSLKATLERMSKINEEDQRIQGILKTLAAACNDEQEIKQKLTALDQAERDAMATWAIAGAKGKAPTFDHATREALNRELKEAEAKAKAAVATAQAVANERIALQSQMREAAGDLKAHALAALFSHAEEYGDAYRQALIDVERNRIFLHTLNLFLASKQDLNDRRTTAFAGPVGKLLEQRDLFMEPIRQQALAEANDHWTRLFASFLRPATAPATAAPAKAAA